MFLWIVLGWMLTQMHAPTWVLVMFWVYIVAKVIYFIYS